MTKKKVLSVIVVIAILLVTSLTVVACNPDGDPINLPKVIGIGRFSDVQIDNNSYTIGFTVGYTTTSFNGSDVRFDSEDIPVQYDFYTDSSCQNRVNFDTYELKVGVNTIYLKVELKEDPSVNIVYTVNITRRDKTPLNTDVVEDTPQDVEITDTDYVKPAKGSITKQEAYDVFAYFMATIGVGSSEHETIEEALVEIKELYGNEDELWSVVQEIASNSGLTSSDAKTLLDALKDADDVIIEMVKAIFDGGPDDLISVLSNEEKVATLQSSAKNILSVVDEDLVITAFDEIIEYAYGKEADLVSYWVLNIYDLSYDDLLKKVKGNDYEQALKDYVNKDNDYFEKLYKANETRNVLAGLIRGVDALLEYDAGEVADVLEVALSLFLTGDIDVSAIFSSTSTISLKDTVGAVNTIGEVLNTMLDACEEDKAFVPSALELLKIFSNNTQLPTTGLWELARMVANLLEKVTVSTASEIYANVDDLQKASPEEYQEKEGYLVASVAKFIASEYEKLSDPAKVFVLRLIGVEHTDAKFIDNLMALCLAKEDIDDFTSEELCAISGQFSLLSYDPDQATVYYKSNNLFIPIGASENDVMTIVASLDSDVARVIDNGNLKKISCDTSTTGYKNLFVETTGNTNYSFVAFVYDDASLERFILRSSSFISSQVICIGLNKGATINDAFRVSKEYGSSNDSGRDQLYSKIKYYTLVDTKAHVYADVYDLITKDNLIITGVDTSKSGWGLGMVSFNNGVLEGMSMPFAYYVVDLDNPVLTDIIVSYNNDTIFIGDTIEDLSLNIGARYDYCRTEDNAISPSQATIIGFNTATEGSREFTVSYAGFTDTVFYKVVSTANYYNPENWELEIDSWDVGCSGGYSNYKEIDGIKHYDFDRYSYVCVRGANMRYSKNGVQKNISVSIYPNSEESEELFSQLGLTAYIDCDLSKANLDSYTDCYAIVTDADGDIWYKKLICRYKLRADISWEPVYEVNSGYMINDVYDAINNTVKVINSIEDEASINVDLYLDLTVDGVTYVAKINLAGSIDEGTYANNWAFLGVDFLGVELGLFAERTSAGKEYLYLCQNILNVEPKWSKLSQAENSNIFVDILASQIFDLIENMDASSKEEIENGFLNYVDVAQTIKNIMPLIGQIIFAPIEGVNHMEEVGFQQFETDFSSENGYAGRFDVEALADLIPAIAPLLSGIEIDLAQYQGFADILVPLILGGHLDLRSFTFTPNPDAIPEIQFFIDLNEDGTFDGLHVSYETNPKMESQVKIEFGIDNVSIKATSMAKPTVITNAVARAEELAFSIGLDVESEIINGGYANFDLNVYPNLVINGFDEEGYLDVDFSKFYAEVVMTYEAEVDYDYTTSTPIYGTETKVIAQYNADGNEDLYLDLYTIGSALGYYASTYKIPVNLSEKYAEYIQSEKDKVNGEEVVVENASASGVVDNVIVMINDLLNGGEVDMVGFVMNLLGDLGYVLSEVIPFIEVFEDTTTIDVEGLLESIFDRNGLIGGSNEPFYYYDECITLGEIAEQITTDQVLGTIADRAGVEVDDLILLIEDFTGATLDADDAYANMEISISSYLQDGMGTKITAVLGADDSTAEISISLSVAIIENKTEYEDVLSEDFYEYEGTAIENGQFVTISNDTGKDGGKGLVDDLKGIFNNIVSDEKFELDTLEYFYGTKVSEEDINETYGAVVAQSGETYGFVDAGFGLNFYVEAVEGSTVYVVNAKGTEAVAQWIVNPMIGPRPMQDMAVVMAESNDEAVFTIAEGQTGLMFTVYGVVEEVTAFAVSVEEPQNP